MHAARALKMRKHDQTFEEIKAREVRFGPPDRRIDRSRDDDFDPDGKWTKRMPHAANAGKPRLTSFGSAP
jgi:hypothetical protein